MPSERRTLDIIIVGGGLVGALEACFFAKRGHHVRLYEYRTDIRMQSSRGVSIDLSLSVRGREALRAVGLEDIVVNQHGTPMKGRMVHCADGTQKEIVYDGVNNNCIYSVNRTCLNKILLNAAEKYPNVKLHFNHKVIDGDLMKGELIFLNTKSQEKFTASADFILGADGAYSIIRRLMSKTPRFNFTQTYIDHGYVELSYPGMKDGKIIMSGNHLHVWPRGEFMMIALPNTDFTFTGNIFAPFRLLEGLDTPEKLLHFYRKHMPDAIELIGEKKLIEEFFRTTPKTLISIKCKPYNVGKALIVGDAAHAMVPFYGQGMNSGFEDTIILDSLMELYNCDLTKVLPHFSEARCDDAAAICDLAMYNYVEMRELVNKKSFLLRKKLDTYLNWMLPKAWIPLYSSVTFSRMRYTDCITNKAWQDRVIRNSAFFFGLIVIAIIAEIVLLCNSYRVK